MKISTTEEFEQLKNGQDMFLLYLNNDTCSIGENVEPKVKALFQSNFPEIQFVNINTDESQVLSRKLNFSDPPTVIFFIEGKEYLRKSRAFGIEELKNEVKRLYDLFLK